MIKEDTQRPIFMILGLYHVYGQNDGTAFQTEILSALSQSSPFLAYKTLRGTKNTWLEWPDFKSTMTWIGKSS